MKKTVAAVVAALAAGVAFGGTLNVPSQDYATIEAALAVAQSGDVVALAVGDYALASADGIVVPAGVTLKGMGADPSKTTVAAVAGTDPASLVTVTGGRLENITFTGARCNNDNPLVPRVLSASEGAFVTNCVFTGHSTNIKGQLVLVTGEGTRVVDTTFSDAVFTGGNNWTVGLGIQVLDGAVVSDSVIDNVDMRVGKTDGTVLLSGGARLLRSTVRNCDISGAQGMAGRAAGVCIDSKGADCLVEDCVIEQNSIGSDNINYGNYDQGAGGLVALSAATVRRTVIRNNTSEAAFCGGVYCTGAATFENCLVAGNRVTAPVDRSECCGGLYAGNAGAVLKHVTVVGNALAGDQPSHKAHGCYLNGAQAVNCIFADNGDSGQNLCVEGATGCATFCLAPTLAECENAANAASGENCLAGDPLFTNAAAGDYTLTASSPALDYGADTLGIADDLCGIARPKNLGFDLGCYECEYAASYTCSILGVSERFVGPAGGTLAFDSSASMAKLVTAYRWTVTAASGELVAEGAEKSFSPVFPAGDNTYTVSLKVMWSDGHEESAPVPVTVRVVRRIDVAPGDNLVAVLASLTGLSSENPVTVQLAVGTYTAANSGVADDAEWMLTLEEGIVLKGAGADATILDGELTRRVLRLRPGSKAMDLTVANAHSQASTASLRGYALDVNGATVENCVVTNGLAANTSGAFLEHCVYLGAGGTIAGTQVCGATYKSSGWSSQGGIVYVSSGTVTNCQIFANSCRDKNCSALTLDGADALAVDCDVYGNTGNGNGFSRVAGSGGASILSGGGRLVRCRVTGNTCNSGSGAYYAGGLCVAGGDALVDCCVITNNASGFDANLTTAVSGGVLIFGKAALRNSLVADNRLTGVTTAKLPVGGGVLVTSKDAKVENCTIVGNTLDGACCEGAGLRLKNASSVVNCIVWNNGGTPAGSSDRMSGNISNETATVTTCWTDDPLFEDGGYRLSISSPCIDAGTNLDWMDGATDLAGDPRIRNGFVDIGAFESEHIPVYECSIQPTSGMLGPTGGTVPLKAVFTMPAFVESVVWTVTAATGTPPAGGEGTDFNLVCPPGENVYTVSLKVTWSGGREATASEPAVIRVVEKYDVAPGDDLASILASLTGLSSDNPVTVNLAAGTYTAKNSGVADDAEWMYVLEEGVVLKGAGAGRTILDGCLTNRVLRLKAGSKAQDLTVANAHSQGSTATLRGYALDVNGATVENCVVTNGFAAETSGNYLEHCVYLGNGGTIAGTQVCGATFKQSGWASQGGIVYVSSGTVTNCQVFANGFRDKNCSALTLDGADALAVDCAVYGNTANGYGFSRVAGSGGASILSGGGWLVRCRVTGNTNGSGCATYSAGGLCVAGGNALVDCCIITNNASVFEANLTTAVAGGVLIFGKATLRNTLVANNRLTGVNSAKVTVGGGVVVTSKDAKVENCTIADNTLDGACCEGAGLRLKNASRVVNCIVWNNGGTPKDGEWMLGNVSNETASVTHTCTTPLAEGEGNTDRDPKLKAKKGYLIRSTSPCVNAGDPTGWTADDVDLLGNPRLRKGTTIDMGCYQAALQGFLLMVR